MRTCILDHLGSWDEVLPLVEFTYNNSYQASCWYQNGESVLVGPELLQQTTEKVQLVRDKLQAS